MTAFDQGESALPQAFINGINIHHQQLGSGPPLLLITGIPGTAANWLPFAEFLKSDFAITVFDNRGSGFSDKPQDYYSVRQMADDAAGLIKHLQLEPVHVFGMSLGGMIAQELAINHLPLLGKLVLGCTNCGGARVIRPQQEVEAAFSYPDDNWPERMRLLAPLAFSAKTRRERPEFIERFIAVKNAEPQPLYAYRRQVGAAVRHDSFDRLAQIKCPTLVITGNADDVIPAVNSETLHRAIPGSQLQYIEDAGHLFFLERPEVTAGAVRDFLNGAIP